MIALKGRLHVNFATERNRVAQAPIFKYSDLIYSQNVKKNRTMVNYRSKA